MAAKVHSLGPTKDGAEVIVFHCPGCKRSHPFTIGGTRNINWTWNGSFEKPTFNPSLLCWASDPKQRCHCFVRDGMIQFLPDCHHELAGQTVEVPDWDS